MTDVVKFQRPETVPIHAEVRSNAGVLVDPTSIKITITPSSGVDIVTSIDMVKDAVPETGKYVYFFRPDVAAPLGWYKVKAVVIDGAGETAITTITPGGFILE